MLAIKNYYLFGDFVWSRAARNYIILYSLWDVLIILRVPRLLTSVNRRQSADCANDLAETGEEPYSTCLEELEKLFPGNPDFSLDNVNTYCRNCPTNILNLFSKIERDCSGQAVSSQNYIAIYTLY